MGNAGSGALPKVRACRAAQQNLLDLAFSRDRIKPKQKDFANFRAERPVRADTALPIARTLVGS